MNLYVILTIITVSICVALKRGSLIAKDIQLHEYDYQRNLEHKSNMKNILVGPKNERKHLHGYFQNNTSILVDGIPHYESNNGYYYDWEKVNKATLDIDKILAAENVEYIYKRDHFWRTWRRITYQNDEKVICYRCDGFVNATCKNCGRFWNIEENCPCPFEFLSMINNHQMCVLNFTQPYKKKKSCPTVITFTDVSKTCDNPIITEYRLKKIFNTRYQKQFDSICGDKYFCNITTFYMIFNDFIIFRLIKSNNNIIYSRVMKPNKKNYYCITNCGIYDQKAKKVNIKSLSTDLNKSETKLKVFNDSALNRTNKKSHRRNKRKKDKYLHKAPKAPSQAVLRAHTVSPCTKLSKQISTEDYEEVYVGENDYGHKFIK